MNSCLLRYIYIRSFLDMDDKLEKAAASNPKPSERLGPVVDLTVTDDDCIDKTSNASASVSNVNLLINEIKAHSGLIKRRRVLSTHNSSALDTNYVDGKFL